MSQIRTLNPTNTIAYADFPPILTTAHGDLSDNNDGTYCYKQGYADGTSYFCYGSSISQIPASGITVVSVTPTCRTKGEGPTATAAGLQGGFISGGVFYNAFAGQGITIDSDPSVIAAHTGSTYSTNPNTSLAWTISDVNSLGWYAGAVNYARDGNIAKVTELHFTVVFTLISPTVTTNAATNTTTSTATLNGTINPSGATADFPVNYKFQYGLTNAYGLETGVVSGATGSADILASAAITGLVNNTTYHFRIVANNAETTVIGADRTFTTGTVDTIVIGF